jgi:drug/metabolite transporter (DMT)-like permease
MQRNDTTLGIWLMIATSIIFAIQDGMSRHLAAEYNVFMIVMIRYWFFAAFVLTLAHMKFGGIRVAAKTTQLGLQIFRGVLLATEICVMVVAFVLLGLVESLAIFAAYPLFVAALSGPVLGEHVGWRRWAAIFAGFVGILFILQPGVQVFSPYALIPCLSATLFALYSLITRFAARKDSAQTSFFWTGIVGAVAMTMVGAFYWEPMSGADWIWMSLLCVTGALGHFLLIKCYEVAEANTVQPFAYFQLLFGSMIGITVFGEMLTWNIALGGAIVVASGLFTLSRARSRAQANLG